jgi:hypothetical protein
MNLSVFNSATLFDAATDLFSQLGIRLNSNTKEPLPVPDLLKQHFKETEIFKAIDQTFFIGLIDDSVFGQTGLFDESYSYKEAVQQADKSYEGLMFFALELAKQPTRTEISDLTRAFNRISQKMPVALLLKYKIGNELAIAFANTERSQYQQTWRNGEKVGKITMLKDIIVNRTHAAHLRILSELKIKDQSINSYAKLHIFWQTKFSLQALNDQFYKDLQAWFYYATQKIKLPFKPDYINEKENIKNFLVRLLARTMFCWFVKEKGLIKHELLELTDWEGNKYKLTNDIDDKDFLQKNSYYRGVLQNVFYNALNQKQKNSAKDFKWTKYLHSGFQIEWLTQIPYLNGGIFDELKPEDNAKESIEDSVISIPNYLFYGIETDETVTKGKGAKATKVVEKVEHKGLNGILKSYKFTLDENTPFEEDIALDPEMLGLVFENLLAELDPNLEESTINSIRKMTGSFYTPRKTIYEMVNDSLFLYLTKFLQKNYQQIEELKKQVSDLVYFNQVLVQNTLFCQAIVHGLDQFKMLDPACGSGAFPMGMLHRMVDILKLVDADNQLWLDIKLQAVDIAQRGEFKKMLNLHLDDYSRKLGIIRDSIYGIDIQPMAVQITKLRFFISLLIDQKTEKGITPMPNIETKIICADSLKNIEADLFSKDAIGALTEARALYYQPDITLDEREEIAVKIVDILDQAFPSFAFQITGKRIPGQNKALIKEWFKHSTLAAPFFNMDFFFPELIQSGGFDCVIGNPPYGGIKITDEVRSALGIESKDPYGAFIARFLNSADKPTPLKQGGVLAYIVSDTFMTIKSHLPLRRMMMQNYIHKMLRMHPDTFRATVNTVIMVAERNVYPIDENRHSIVTFNDDHICLMADLTNISIHDNYDRFIEVLNQTKGVDYDVQTLSSNVSNEEYAIYYYPQSLIRTNSNLPFFVASPKLFTLMNDGNDKTRAPKSQTKEIGGKKVNVRTIAINGNEIQIVKLGDIAEVKQGLATGDNDAYLFQNPEARGNYKNIEDFKEYLLTEVDLAKICNIEPIRLLVIDNGISKDDPNSKCYFGGRYIIPYDKGGESDAEGGWMPNYYVPTNYFIDWSEWSVSRLKTLTTKDRNHLEGKDEGDDRLCSRFQNVNTYFTEAITFSPTGVYAPTFRIHLPSVYDKEGSCIFCDIINIHNQNAIFSSKITKYFQKCVVNSTVHSMQGDVIEIIVPILITDKIKEAVIQLIDTQKTDPEYDYASHEQIEIDKLVYEAYGLTAEDVQEVENWYARRYCRLSAAQKANLRALGKSDNYLELYGMKV